MPPRKKSNASSSSSSTSKKSTQKQSSQPSKYGIQHFFDRHSLSSSSAQNPKPASAIPDDQKSNLQRCVLAPKLGENGSKLGCNGVKGLKRIENGVSEQGEGLKRENIEVSEQARVPKSVDFAEKPAQNPKIGLNLGGLKRVGNGSEQVRVPKSAGLVAVGVIQNPKNGLNVGTRRSSNPSQNTPPENLLVDLTNSDDVCEISPQVSKSIPRKRFKFSPGMLIKQSQDDGGEDVTWKVSPVNERLQAISKLAPDEVKALADASRLNSSSFEQLSDRGNTHNSEGKVENGLPLPILEVPKGSPMLPNGTTLKRVSQGQDMNMKNREGNAVDMNNSGASSTQSPFRTPPSLSYHNNKPIAVHNDCLREWGGLRQHKRALIELLDQVENAISVEGSPLVGSKMHSSRVSSTISYEKSVKDNSVISQMTMKGEKETDFPSSDPCFLVLEVTEKHGAQNSAGAQCSSKVLRVLNEQSGKEQSVHLWDDWFYSVIEPGATIRVIGEFDFHGNCDVNHEKNLLIVHPNILLSGTRVAGSFSCSRRAVLDERLKSSEYSTAALIGTLLHQIFQAGLLMENPTIDLLHEFSKIVLQKNIENLYACGVLDNDMQETLNEAIPKICNWIELFRHSQKSNAPTVDFGPNDGLRRVSICDVVDIEEMAWAPKYGLKGVIDASIRVQIHSNSKEVDEKIIPLEFKTGKATTGQSFMEHSAQLILYTLLMSERYLQTIDSGLLYYLSTDQTKGIIVRRPDLIGLIMHRNELAHYIIKASMVQQLPPMVQSPNTCRGCRHLNACTIYHKVHGGSAESSGLGDVFESLTDHLTTSHRVFFKQWDRLIDLEAKELQISKNGTRRSHVSKNESFSSCLSSIVLDASDELHPQTYANDSCFVYRFVRKDNPSPNERGHNNNSKNGSFSVADDLDCSLRSGDRVILSTESSHLAVASGIIRDITRSHVSVSFSKRLRLPRSTKSSISHDLYEEVWRLEKDEFATSYATMRFNLVQLFIQSARSGHLRKLIVDLEAPRFDSGSILSQDPAISYIWSERNLNDDQRRAIVKILTAKDYALILGMPGTGKTSTMVYAVKALLMRGASILLTSYTNSAVDNLLIKLKAEGIDFLRIGRLEVVHKDVQGHCLSDMDIRSVEEIKLKLDQVKVVAVTCLGITSPLLANKKFDVCIIDEAGQTNLPVSLGPLMFASMFVLVGDHYQLPPLVKSAEARESGMSVSLFRRLSEGHPQAISALQSQYRMCAGIMKLSNALIYGDRLRCGSPDVENAKLKLSNGGSMCSWLKKVLDPDKPVIFINTDILPAFEVKDQKTVNNPVEAYIVAEVTEALANHGVEREEIGIITPYNSQATLIQLVVNMTSVEVHTIDKYQGRDKDCILVSFVRSSPNPRNCSSSLLGDWHRINVALTRAKKKLIMVGSCKTLSRVPVLKLLINEVDEQSGIFCLTRDDIEPKTQLKRCSQVR